MRFSKAHAYGNDFLYVLAADVDGQDLGPLARELCDRHTGIGGDGLIVYRATPDGASMGLPVDLRQVTVMAAGESLQLAVMTFGNPQCVTLGPLPDEDRFRRLGPALERHSIFPERSNVEFAHVEAPDTVRILIWERGVGPTMTSGTGSCAALIAAARFGGAARDADVVAPGGRQRVQWRDDIVYLTGWAEVLFEGNWLR